MASNEIKKEFQSQSHSQFIQTKEDQYAALLLVLYEQAKRQTRRIHKTEQQLLKTVKNNNTLRHEDSGQFRETILKYQSVNQM